MALRRNNTRPGPQLSTHQFFCSLKGRLYQTRAREPDSYKFLRLNIYERVFHLSRSRTSHKFLDKLRRENHIIVYCGVGAHH